MPLLTLILQIALILSLSRIMGLLFGKLRQPQVMGEIVAGIMLGPSLFGLVAPGVWQDVFPQASIANLDILSQVGIIFFLFLVGLELDPKLIENMGRAALVISNVSIVFPFVLGVGLAFGFYGRLFVPGAEQRFLPVALFMGAAMSVTAFPVLARILTERNLHRTRVGAVAITCAAVNDLTAWWMLAFLIAIARAQGVHGAIWTGVSAAGYVVVMFWVVRPFLKRLELFFERQGRLSQNVVAIIFLLVLGSAYVTQAIGIHALFGAFLMGAIMPKGTRFVRTLADKLEDYTVVLLLPIFFAYTGLQTRIGLLNDPQHWVDTGVIILVACVGKFGGATLAARACKMEWRESAAIGILMNTRGLMELIILNIGRELHVISDTVFAMLVIMALVTTALTTPILQWVYPARLFDLTRGAEGVGRKRYSILVPVSRPASVPTLVHLADLLSAGRAEGRVIYPLYLNRPVDREAYRASIEVSEGTPEALGPILKEAADRKIPAEPICFVSRDVPADIARAARAKEVNLVLMGFHQPVFGQGVLGGTVHHVLTGTDANVAVFVDRGLKQVKSILVPFLGGHDVLAMQLADQLARAAGAELTVLHVVSPKREEDEPRLNVKEAVDRMFKDPTQPRPVRLKIVEDESPVDLVVAEAGKFDLVVIGVAEEWGLASHLFGLRPERIAGECQTSMLIVRQHN